MFTGARTHADVSLFSKLGWLPCQYKTTTTLWPNFHFISQYTFDCW